MIEGASPVLQSLFGTLFTWALTAAGAGVVFVLPGAKRTLLDRSLGFAAGVMVAASFWSLLLPAIEIAESSGNYGSFSFLPVSIGFLLGAAFVYTADVLMSVHSHVYTTSSVTDVYERYKKLDDYEVAVEAAYPSDYHGGNLRERRYDNVLNGNKKQLVHDVLLVQWKRILLLVIAITVHNIPEGLAVGVGFGAVGKAPLATFSKAKNLAIGIGIQNFPEGMAVSLPLHASGRTSFSAFWWGQLSGMVEPVAGIIGTVAITWCEPLLPYALAFAAGAMIYVVVDDIIPEAQMCGNGKLASSWCIIGFIAMMVLDVGLA